MTLSAPEQIRLADASEASEAGHVETITLHATLAGASPAGQGTYAQDATLRWLVAGGYGLRLDMQDGHAPEDGNMVRLRGLPVHPSYVDRARP